MRVAVVLSLVLVGAAVALVFALRDPAKDPAGSALAIDQLHAFCAKCHAFSTPDSLAKADWPEQIRLMYALVQPESWPASTLPAEKLVTDYYVARAPDQLVIRPASQPGSGGLEFDRHGLWYLPDLVGFGSVTHVQFAQLVPDGERTLLVC